MVKWISHQSSELALGVRIPLGAPQIACIYSHFLIQLVIMSSHERETLDRLKLLIDDLPEQQLGVLPYDLQIAIAMEDETMQQVFSRGEFPKALAAKTGLGDNAVRKSLISLRDNDSADLRYIPEESRMVLGDIGRDWLFDEINREVKEN